MCVERELVFEMWNEKQQKKVYIYFLYILRFEWRAACNVKCIGVTTSNWTNRNNLLVWSANLAKFWSAIIMQLHLPRIHAVIGSFTHMCGEKTLHNQSESEWMSIEYGKNA